MSVRIHQEGRRFVIYVDGEPTGQFAYTRAKAEALARRAGAGSASPPRRILRNAGRLPFAARPVSGADAFRRGASGIQKPLGTDFNAAFWRWFGDSKVVDAAGRPQVLYYGTQRTAAAFNLKALKAVDGSNRGFVLSDDPRREVARLAQDRSGACFDPFDAAQGVFRVYVKMANPLILDAGGRYSDAIYFNGAEGLTEIAERVRRSKYDGIIVHNVLADVDEGRSMLGTDRVTLYFVFDPRNIKSAIHNQGTWDPSDPDIRR